MNTTWLAKYPRAAAMLQQDDTPLDYDPDGDSRAPQQGYHLLPDGSIYSICFSTDRDEWQLHVRREGMTVHAPLIGPFAPLGSPDFHERHLAPLLAHLAMEIAEREDAGIRQQ